MLPRTLAGHAEWGRNAAGHDREGSLPKSLNGTEALSWRV
jgi:hypothetical protein